MMLKGYHPPYSQGARASANVLLIDFLTLASRAAYVLISGITLVQFLRQRDRTRLDVALMFGSLAVAGLVDTFQEFTGLRPAWMSTLNDLAFLAQPYLLVRMVSLFRPVRRRIQAAALAGMLAAWVAALLRPPPPTALFVLVLAGYYVLAEAYAVTAFVRVARSTRGVTRARNMLAAAGAGLVVAVIVVAAVGSLAPALREAVVLAAQFLGLASGLAWYFAFAPPGWLRQYWQLRELQRFLRAQAGQAAEARAAQALPLLCEMAARATGARAALAVRWEADEKRLVVAAASPPGLSAAPLSPEAGAGPVQQAWRAWRPVAQRALPTDADGSQQLTLALEAELVYAAPLGTAERRRGLLVVLMQRRPLFVDDDLGLLALLCEQANLALEQWELLKAQEEALRRELVEAATAAERERLRVTLASIGDAVIATDTAGRLTFINAVAEALTGWTQAEALGQPAGQVFQIVNEQTRARVESPVARVLSEGRIVGLANHTLLRRRDGSEVPIDDSGAPIYDDAERLLGVVLVFRDVTARRQAEATRTFLAALIEASDDAIIGADLEGAVLSWNPGAERLYGYTAEEMRGQPIGRLTPPHRSADGALLLDRLKRGEAIHPYETEHLRQDGRLITVALTLSVIRDSDGQATGASLTVRDVTRERQAQERLARLQSVTAELGRAVTPAEVAEVIVAQLVPALQAGAGVVVRAAAEGALEMVAHAGYPAEALARWAPLLAGDGPLGAVLHGGEAVFLEGGSDSPEDGLGDSARAMVPLAAGDEVLAVLALSYWTKQRFGPEERAFLLGLAAQGGEALARARVYGEAQALAAELEQRVQARTAELQTLMGRLQSVREEERARMAREIHDELGGTITGLKMDLAQVRRALPPEAERAEERLAQLGRALDQTVQVVRRIASDLRPGVLDDFGLVAALEWQLQDFGRRAGLDCRFRASVEQVDLEREQATAVFRIFQEALTNIGRHANASRVDVSLAQSDGVLTLHVQDNGRGIAPERALSRESFGLASMRERARLLSGKLVIEGSEDRGTTVLIQIPVDGRTPSPPGPAA
jgi:PAS domain S-box-containing protein